MANYSDLAQIALQSDFQNRVRYSLYVAAVNVHAEDAGTASHTARLAFSNKVLSGAYDLASAVFAVLTNSTIAAEATASGSGNSVPDGDLQFTMNSVYNGLAGV